jgi:thymidylate synthase (FAD)
MRVLLVDHTPDPERVVAAAARLCYSSLGLEELLGEEGARGSELIERILQRGHYSVLEHATFSFGIEGISRATSHQLVRHRIASYSQQSQRYVREKGRPAFVTPPSVEADSELSCRYVEEMQRARELYDAMVAAGIPLEDARYVLPNAVETKLIVSMNARELLHFFRLRTCNRAQWEMRRMAKEMLDLVKSLAPTVFAVAGPACLQGACPEGEMTCGKAEEVRREFMGGDRRACRGHGEGRG